MLFFQLLWDLIEPLLPIPEDKPEGGRPRRSDRACLTGILFVLRSGIPWRMLPKELGCGSGMTCWRRLRDGQEAGSWQLIHFVLLDWLARYGQIDWSRAVLDSCSIRAVFGGFKPVPIPPTERSFRSRPKVLEFEFTGWWCPHGRGRSFGADCSFRSL
jgi:transposase